MKSCATSWPGTMAWRGMMWRSLLARLRSGSGYGFGSRSKFAGMLEVVGQLAGNFGGDVGAGPSELRAERFLRCRPDNVAFFVHQTDGDGGFVFALRDARRFILADAEADTAAGGAAGSRAAHLRAGLDTFTGLKRI